MVRLKTFLQRAELLQQVVVGSLCVVLCLECPLRLQDCLQATKKHLYFAFYWFEQVEEVGVPGQDLRSPEIPRWLDLQRST